jgi:hypothetical protein
MVPSHTNERGLQIIEDMIPFLMVNLIVLLGFSSAFFSLYGPAWAESVRYRQGSELVAPFSTAGSALMLTFAMVFGEFDPEVSASLSVSLSLVRP